MSRYTQSIIVFGLIIPAFLFSLVIGGALYGKNTLTTQKVEKKKVYEGFLQSTSKVGVIEEQLNSDSRRDQMAYWEEKLGKDFIQNLSLNLNEVLEPLTEKQLMRTELSRPPGRSSLVKSEDVEHSRLKLSFEGGYGPMQRVLAELEIRMPQLVLEKLEIVPTSGTGSAKARPLRFDLTYLCWHDSGSQRK